MKRLVRHLIKLVLALSSTGALRGQTYELVHQFEFPGPRNPNELIQDSDGNFYGTTETGGHVEVPSCISGCGTVFRMDGDGVVTTLHEFIAGEGGARPRAGLFRASNGDLYGTTEAGGSATCGNCGTIFRIDSSGIFTTVHRFEGPDGRHPSPAALIEPQPGDLWGTTRQGGSPCPDDPPAGCGTIFRMHFNGDLETMHAFSGDDGVFPSGLVLADDGNLYGGTWGGGVVGAGNIFRITLNGNLTVIHEFNEASYPTTLIQASSGDLVGTLIVAGGVGSVFRMTLDGDFETLHAFASDGHEGTLPYARILQASDGFFYGATAWDGANDTGTVFQLGENGSFSTIHNFGIPAGPDGTYPFDGLMQAADGRLYGPTSGGGVGDAGVIYRITLPGVTRYYCPTDFVRRDQMAAFLLKIEHGAAYVPPDCSGQFPDVACPSLFANWIEQLAAEGVTAGCGGGNYCPLSPVTRAQMAVFLLKTEHGAAYTPPPCAGAFPDVACPSTFADWIEQLAGEGITSGCGVGNFCPDSPVTRAQMAVFLLKIEHGSAFAPPACQALFADVACPSQFANWIEALYAEGITAGCAGP